MIATLRGPPLQPTAPLPHLPDGPANNSRQNILIRVDATGHFFQLTYYPGMIAELKATWKSNAAITADMLMSAVVLAQPRQMHGYRTNAVWRLGQTRL